MKWKRGTSLLLVAGLGCSRAAARNDAGTVSDASADSLTDAPILCTPGMFAADPRSFSIRYRVEPPRFSLAGECWVHAFDAVVEFGTNGARLQRSACMEETIEGYDGPISDDAVASILANLSDYCVVQNPPPCTRADGTYFLLAVTSAAGTAEYLIGTTGECSRSPAVRNARGPADALVQYLKTLGTTTVLADAGVLDAEF